eukprot:scaffold34309_cov27-Tisochrysis_lutea.AAC.1
MPELMCSKCATVILAALEPKSLPSVWREPNRRSPSSASGAASAERLSRLRSTARITAAAPKRNTSSGLTLRPSTSPATSVKDSCADIHEREIATPRSLDWSAISDSRRARRLRLSGAVSTQPPSHQARLLTCVTVWLTRSWYDSLACEARRSNCSRCSASLQLRRASELAAASSRSPTSAADVLLAAATAPETSGRTAALRLGENRSSERAPPASGERRPGGEGESEGKAAVARGMGQELSPAVTGGLGSGEGGGEGERGGEKAEGGRERSGGGAGEVPLRGENERGRP